MTIKRQYRKAVTRFKRKLGMRVPMAVVRFKKVEPPMSQKPQLPIWKLLWIAGLLVAAIYLQYRLRS